MPAPSSSPIDPAPGHLVQLARDGAGEQPGLLAVLAGAADPAGAGMSSRRLRCETYLPTGKHFLYRGATAPSSRRARRARMCYSAGLSSVIPLSPVAQEGSDEFRL